MPKISIIVPVFNAEQYLRRSITSIRNQTLQDIEIILVNDGSTDQSLAICLEQAKDDSRIRVINKSNGGVSSARNAGIDVANGEYIGFIDSDDYVESDMYRMMYDKIGETRTDLCMCNFIIERQCKSIRVALPFDEEVYDRQNIVSEFIAGMLAAPTLDSGASAIMGSVWRLLIRRSLVEESHLRFLERIYFMEDLIFTVNALMISNSLSVDHNFHYHYTIHDDSASQSYDSERLQTSLKVYTVLEDMLNSIAVNYPILSERMDLRYVHMHLGAIANECHVENRKNPLDRIRSIRLLCQDYRLKRVLETLDTSGYTHRKKSVLAAVRCGWGLYLFLYYSFLSRLSR